MEVLTFDVERGTKVLGSKEYIEKLFSAPIMKPDTWNDFKKLMGQVYNTEIVKEEKSFGDLHYTEKTEVMKPSSSVNPDVIVIDTISELFKKYQRTLTSGDGKMEIQDWGKLKNVLDRFLEKVTKVPCNLICNCHGKMKQTTGGSKFLPYIDGSTKEDISKWFDFVLYADTVKKKGKNKYIWYTEHTYQHAHAKDRSRLLDPVILQDYSQVFDAAKKRGWNTSKILIIGEPGSGKTLSLNTIPGLNKKEA